MHDSTAQDTFADGQCSNSPPEENPGTSLRRACESCRSRKIRCDKNCPCYQCVQANILCTKTTRRPRVKRHRVAATVRYEEKIDLIDRRLDRVVQILQNLQTSSPPPGAQNTPSASSVMNEADIPVKISSAAFVDTSQSAMDSPVVEGDSSFATQSAFANEFLRKAVRDSSFHDPDHDMNATLESLHCLIGALKMQTAKTEMSYPLARSTIVSTISGHELPPIETTVKIIRIAKTKPSETLAWIYDFIPLEYFSDICLRIYFSGDFSLADFIIANACLLHLFLEDSRSTSADSTKSLYYARICRVNLESSLVNLPLHLPGTTNMISALLLGAFHTIEISKPSLAWTLTSRASELCQTLGYHRLSSAKVGNDTEDMQHKQILFWSVYFMDKSLSLRLGRASTLQNWNITTPMLPAHSNRYPLSSLVSMWVNTARCQGNIYETLYSPEAMVQSDEIRLSRVQALSNELQSIGQTACEITKNNLEKARERFGERVISFITLSDDVLRLSLLTLVYRASPIPEGFPSAFIPDCIEAARTTLKRHQDFLTIFQDVNSFYFINYVHWTLLFAPFTPFIVLFCHIIETQDEKDVKHLNDFVTSMESASSLSDAASKMHHLFKVLYKIASRYVEYCSSTIGEQRGQEHVALNTYLTTLGFPPMNQGHFQQHNADVSTLSSQGFSSEHITENNIDSGVERQIVNRPVMSIGQTMELGEWFNGNHDIMELIEEPNFMFS